MQTQHIIEIVPSWLFYVITVIVVLAAVGCGLWLGARVRHHGKSTGDAPIGSIVGAILGLVAFMLAFTFGSATSRFDMRKQLLLEEVNAIGTVYLRTDFLDEAVGDESRAMLRRYVDLRVDAGMDRDKLPVAMEESEAIQDRLWMQMRELPRDRHNSVLAGLYVEALNSMFDLQSKRATVALQYRIPDTIWVMLYAVTALAMVSVGYQFGVSGTKSRAVILLLALSFSAVIFLIADLDRIGAGVLRVSQQPVLELQKRLVSPEG